MDVVGVLIVAARRWYVVLALFAVAAAAAVGVSQEIQPTYHAMGSLLLTTPYATGVGEGEISANPYSDLPTTATVLNSSAISAAGAQQIGDDGGRGTYAIGIEPNRPILDIDASSKEPAIALRTYASVVKYVNADLKRRQSAAGVPGSAFVVTSAISTPERAVAKNGTRSKVLIGVLGLGLVAAIGGALLFDRLARGGPGPSASDADNVPLGLEAQRQTRSVANRERSLGASVPARSVDNTDR